jgi:ADP-ribose pyrophosphatase YjhB (NUDIX family)
MRSSDPAEMLMHLRGDSDLWSLPGGQVEDGASPAEDVVREVGEETGPDVAVNRLMGTCDRPGLRDITSDVRAGPYSTLQSH